ncbi:hypothetical protein GCM10027614_60480 [Micromonospora vulcania]
MADMGFLPQVTKLLEQVAPQGQRMLFSATLDGGVDRLVRRFLSSPVTHSVDPGTATVTAMTHHVLHVDALDKPAALTRIAAREGRTILFMGTKHRADRLARQLLSKGTRGRAARRQVPAAAHPDPGAVPQRSGDGPGRHGRGGPRHPRRRPGHGGQRGPADRGEGLPAPGWPDRPGR